MRVRLRPASRGSLDKTEGRGYTGARTPPSRAPAGVSSSSRSVAVRVPLTFLVAAFFWFPSTAVADPWARVSAPGFGDAGNTELSQGATFFAGSAVHLYFGTKSTSTGSQIWRSSDGVSWSQANGSGFDSAGALNQEARWLTSFNGALLAGIASTRTPAGVNARIYRSATGIDPWTLVFSTVTSRHANDLAPSAFAAFRDRFYIGTWNPISGCEVWRSSSADWAGAWVLVSTGGFGQGTNNTEATAFKAHADALFAASGAASTERGQLWRSVDGASWGQVTVASNSFSTATLALSALESFEGFLYAGTRNGSGAQLWRTAAPESGGPWTQLFSPDGDGISRFATAASSDIRSLGAFNGILYAGTWDPGFTAGAVVYRSTDGLSWTPSNAPGFGSPLNQWAGGFAATGTFIYAGVRNDALGGAVWRSSAVFPASPAFSGMARGVSSITWSWSGARFSEGFRIVSSTGGNLSGDIPPTTLSWTETGLSTNTAHSRGVAAFNVLGIATSAISSLHTLAMPPAGTSISSVFGSSMTLAWNANTNPPGASYRIRFWQAGGSTTTVDAADTGATLTGLIGATTYFLDVSGINGNGIVSDPDAAVSTLTWPVFVAASTLTAGSGRTILAVNTAAGVLTLTVPVGSFSTDIALTAWVPAAFPAGAASAAATLLAAGLGIQIDASLPIQPALPVTLSVPYRDADVAGLDPAKLILARFDPTRGLWVPLPSSPDLPGKRVLADTNHLSVFQLMQASPASGLSAVAVFPNPLRPAAGHGSMTLSNLPAGARIRLYTAIGELVRDFSANASGMAAWNGTNSSGARVASGVYFAVVEANGERRVIKAAVQR